MSHRHSCCTTAGRWVTGLCVGVCVCMYELIYTVVLINLYAPCRICKYVNKFNKIWGIMKIAYYCLFNTVLNKLFHIAHVYIFSTKQNNNWIYKNEPGQKFTYPWILIICVFLDDPLMFFCLGIVVHESLVGSEQFNCLLFFRKVLQLLHINWFSNIFCIFEPFPKVTMILRSIFSHWGQLRDSYTAITKGVNIYWCSRRQHNALTAGGVNFWTGWWCVHFSYFV